MTHFEAIWSVAELLVGSRLSNDKEVKKSNWGCSTRTHKKGTCSNSCDWHSGRATRIDSRSLPHRSL